MKINLLKIAVMFCVIFNIYSVNAVENNNNNNDKKVVKFISQINNIAERKTGLRVVDGSLQLELADRVFFSEETPCGKEFQPINSESVSL